MAARSKALDGARGCGFLLVLLAHIDPARFMVGGVLGVGFFFVLSGYLITQQAVRSTGMLEYYRRRFQRILPLLYLYLCLNALVAVALGHSMRGYGWHFAFMSDWLSSWNLAPKTGGVVGHLWTIAIEAQFYLVWPVILAIAGPKRIYVLLALIGGAILWRMLVGDAYLATMTLPARIDAFAAGGLAAIAAHRKWRAPTLIAGAVAVSYAIISVPISQFAQPTGWSSAAPSMLAGMAAAFAALVSILAEVQPRALEYRPLTWAGERAYSLYIWHVPLLLAAEKIPLSPAFRLVLGVAATLGVAWLSHIWIEAKFTELIDRAWRDWSARKSAAVDPVQSLLAGVELHKREAA